MESRFWNAVSALRESGLTVREIEANEGPTTMLGWQVEGAGVLRPSPKRVWRIGLAIGELLRRGRSSGQQVEQLIGPSLLYHFAGERLCHPLVRYIPSSKDITLR